jgi:hypothetical protein
MDIGHKIKTVQEKNLQYRLLYSFSILEKEGHVAKPKGQPWPNALFPEGFSYSLTGEEVLPKRKRLVSLEGHLRST